MEFVEIVLVHAGERSVLSLLERLHCGRASRRWREAVLDSLPMLRALDFHGYVARVTGPDVLAALACVAGANITAVDLARCRQLGAADVEQILACVAATCPRVADIDVTGCNTRAVIRAVAVRARDTLAAHIQVAQGGCGPGKTKAVHGAMDWVEAFFAHTCQFGLLSLPVLLRCGRVSRRWREAALRWGVLAAASPLDLFALLEGLGRGGEEEEEEQAGGRCSFRRVCAQLRTLPAPHLVLDPEFTPEENAGDSEWEEEIAWDGNQEPPPGYLDRLLGKEVSEGRVWAAALLLGVSFGQDHDGNARICACDAITNYHKRDGRRVLHVAAERGDADMVSLLVRAGADVDVRDGLSADPYDMITDNTPLLLACRAGHREAAKMLLDKGADASAANVDGDTPLRAALKRKNVQLARELVARGAAVADALSSAILSGNEACIKFALTLGPMRDEGQGALDLCAFLQRLAQAVGKIGQMRASWYLGGAAPSALTGELGALLSEADVGSAARVQLERARAFLNHHRSPWTVRHELSHYFEILRRRVSLCCRRARAIVAAAV